jgi:hypothetical protein
MIPGRLWAYGSVAAVVAAALGYQALRINSLKTTIAEERLAASKQREAAVNAAIGYMRNELERANRLAIETQGILRDEVTKRLELEGDVAAATAVGNSLRDAARSAARRCSAPPSPANAASSPATKDPGLVLADVLAEVESLGRAMAEEADRRGIAGSTCERERDALTTR